MLQNRFSQYMTEGEMDSCLNQFGNDAQFVKWMRKKVKVDNRMIYTAQGLRNSYEKYLEKDSKMDGK
ncbi:unnamed protein product [Caenorhabditis angaria]|uniref:Uncharacterized protein n=1 Tax=Caenorhabditis angaria TaxID=860376 RepID=A0A9P1IME6_9PELO|nr:unnamed protein product [Caenorhabditis angaria]